MICQGMASAMPGGDAAMQTDEYKEAARRADEATRDANHKSQLADLTEGKQAYQDAVEAHRAAREAHRVAMRLATKGRESRVTHRRHGEIAAYHGIIVETAFLDFNRPQWKDLWEFFQHRHSKSSTST
jgi:hypothetical protein